MTQNNCTETCLNSVANFLPGWLSFEAHIAITYNIFMFCDLKNIIIKDHSRILAVLIRKGLFRIYRPVLKIVCKTFYNIYNFLGYSLSNNTEYI